MKDRIRDDIAIGHEQPDVPRIENLGLEKSDLVEPFVEFTTVARAVLGLNTLKTDVCADEFSLRSFRVEPVVHHEGRDRWDRDRWEEVWLPLETHYGEGFVTCYINKIGRIDCMLGVLGMSLISSHA